MIIKETRAKSLTSSYVQYFTLVNKVSGSNLECPITITKNGVELTTAEYHTENDYTDKKGPFDITIDFSKYISSTFGGDVNSFVAHITKMGISSKGVYFYNYSTSAYETTLVTSKGNLTNLIDSNGIIKMKAPVLNSFTLELTTKSSTVASPSTIVADLNDKFSILLQGVTCLFYAGSSTRHSLLDYQFKIPASTLIDFSGGTIPSNATTVGAGAVIDSTTFTGESVLKMGNSGIDDSTASISFPIELSSKGNIDIELYISTEANYDQCKIYLDSRLVFNCSGNSGTTSIDQDDYDNADIKSDQWSTYTLKNINEGSHTIKIEYSKDSSNFEGKDNVFVRKITKSEVTNSFGIDVASNRVHFTKNFTDLLSTSFLDIDSHQSFNVLLTNSNPGLEIKVLQSNGEVTTDTDKTITTMVGNDITFKLLDESSYGYGADSFLDAMYIINKELTETEKTNILKGTQLGFKKSRILTGAIDQGRSYKLTGTATLYINDGVSRTVTTDFNTSTYENYIVIDEASECTRTRA